MARRGSGGLWDRAGLPMTVRGGPCEDVATSLVLPAPATARPLSPEASSSIRWRIASEMPTRPAALEPHSNLAGGGFLLGAAGCAFAGALDGVFAGNLGNGIAVRCSEIATSSPVHSPWTASSGSATGHDGTINREANTPAGGLAHGGSGVLDALEKQSNGTGGGKASFVRSGAGFDRMGGGCVG